MNDHRSYIHDLITSLFTVVPITPFELLLNDKKLLPGDTIKTADFFHIGIGLHEGSQVIYDWKLGEERFTKPSRSLWYKFDGPGVYDVEVTASNSNNSYTAGGTIVVQDTIKLKCVSGSAAVIPMEGAVVKWAVDKGSVLA